MQACLQSAGCNTVKQVFLLCSSKTQLRIWIGLIVLNSASVVVIRYQTSTFVSYCRLWNEMGIVRSLRPVTYGRVFSHPVAATGWVRKGLNSVQSKSSTTLLWRNCSTKHRKWPQRTTKDCTGPQRTPERPQRTLQDFVNFLLGY